MGLWWAGPVGRGGETESLQAVRGPSVGEESPRRGATPALPTTELAKGEAKGSQSSHPLGTLLAPWLWTMELAPTWSRTVSPGEEGLYPTLATPRCEGHQEETRDRPGIAPRGLLIGAPPLPSPGFQRPEPPPLPTLPPACVAPFEFSLTQWF